MSTRLPPISPEEDLQAQQLLRQLSQRHEREIIQQAVAIAIPQTKRLVAYNVEQWISHSMSLTNTADIENVLEETLNEVVHKHRQTVGPKYTEEFRQLVKNGCTSFCRSHVSTIATTIASFVAAMSKHFEENGCFLPNSTKIEELCQNEKERICAGQASPSAGMEHVCNKLTQLYINHNRRVYDKEIFYAGIIASEIFKTYEAEMAAFAQQCPCKTELLQVIHTNLKAQYLATFNHIFVPRENKRFEHVRSEVSRTLESDLNNSFGLMKKTNEKKVKKLMDSTTKQIERITENLKSSEVGPIIVTEDLCNLLQMEIKAISMQHGGPTTNIKSTWKNLQISRNSRWCNEKIKILHECVNQAVTQMDNILPELLNEWIQSHLNLNNVKDATSVKIVYEASFNELVSSYRSVVHPALFEEFVELVEKKVQARLLPILKAVSDFVNFVEQRFLEQGYFYKDCLSAGRICLEECFKIQKSVANLPLFVQETILLACEKLLNEYGSLLLIAEEMKPGDLEEKIKALYTTTMQHACSQEDTPEKIHQVHNKVVDSCTQSFEKASRYFWQDPNCRFAQARKLREELNHLLSIVYKVSFDENLKTDVDAANGCICKENDEVEENVSFV